MRRSSSHSDATDSGFESDLSNCGNVTACASLLRSLTYENTQSETLPDAIAVCLDRFFSAKAVEGNLKLLKSIDIVCESNIESFVQSKSFVKSLVSIEQLVSVDMPSRRGRVGVKQELGRGVVLVISESEVL